MKKYIVISTLFAVGLFTANVAMAAIWFPPAEPTSVDQCKKGGWLTYGDMFKNQGDCVSFVVTEGRNAPDGPAK